MLAVRVLMISALEVWALAGQGGAPSLYKTLEGYGRRGHEVDFVTSTVGANHHYGAAVQEPPEIPGVRFHRFHLPSLQESRLPLGEIGAKVDQKLRFALLFPELAARRARRVLRERRPDVLYGYEVHGVLASRLLRLHEKLPLVARFQGTVMHPYLDSKPALARRYEEVVALRTPADLYVMTDDGTQGEAVLRRLNPRSQGKTRFWRNGLDLDKTRAPSPEEAQQAREALGLAPDDFVLVTASRLARWKRTDRAIDAVALLKSRGVHATLLVVGDGEERGNLERQAVELGVADRVRFTGGVPQAEVQRYLWAADVFLSVNELSNVGNPLLEAMLVGRCIVTLDEGDTRSLVRDGETGVLLASGEPGAIAAALASLRADPSRRQRLAEGALALAKATFWSWEQRIDAEVAAVEGLVAAPSAVGAG
jgi:glycosyltransferase involved in cell wall biosynthesis